MTSILGHIYYKCPTCNGKGRHMRDEPRKLKVCLRCGNSPHPGSVRDWEAEKERDQTW